MDIYFDMEFTGLHKDTTPISIGLVDNNGEKLYLEFTDYDKSQCNEWINKNVIDNLMPDSDETIVCDKEKGSQILKDWLLQYEKVIFVTDVGHYDAVLLFDLLGKSALDMPSNICPTIRDINQDIADALDISIWEAFDYSREELIEKLDVEIKGKKHNSLYDAEVIKALALDMGRLKVQVNG